MYMYFRERNSSGSETPNLDFYTGKIKSEPRGDYIDNIHSKWFGDYDRLESHHGFIQWLFPNREDVGVNWHASRLSKKEAEIMSKDEKIKKRVLKSFHMMLDFWGMRLDEKSMTFSRTEDYKERYYNWCGGHNNLRITRTLKSLGDLGLGQYKKPWVEFLMNEILAGEITGCSSSLMHFWIPTLTKKEQDELLAIWEKKAGKENKKRKRKVWIHSEECKINANAEE